MFPIKKNLKLYLSLTLLWVSGYLFSQTNAGVGLRAGVNLLPTNKDEVSGRQLYAGFNGGGFGVKNLNNRLKIKVEFNYTAKAKQFSYTEKSSLLGSITPMLGGLTGGLIGPSSDSSSIIDPTVLNGYINDTVYSYYRGTDKLKFIELPVILSCKVGLFDIGLGGYVSLLTSAKSKTQLTQQSDLLNLIQPAIDSLGFAGGLINNIIEGQYPAIKEPQITESTKTDYFTKVDYGLIADLTYNYAPHLFFNLRYQYGFPNYRIHALVKPDNYTSITFSFGYLFNLNLRTGKTKI